MNLFRRITEINSQTIPTFLTLHCPRLSSTVEGAGPGYCASPGSDNCEDWLLRSLVNAGNGWTPQHFSRHQFPKGKFCRSQTAEESWLTVEQKLFRRVCWKLISLGLEDPESNPTLEAQMRRLCSILHLAQIQSFKQLFPRIYLCSFSSKLKLESHDIESSTSSWSRIAQ